MKKTYFIATISAFVILSVIFFILKQYAPEYSFPLLISANILLVVLSLISFTLVTKQDKTHTNSFIRGVYMSTFLKLMICMVAIVAYIVLNKHNIHKPSIFILFGIYATYSAIETWSLSKIARQPK